MDGIGDMEARVDMEESTMDATVEEESTSPSRYHFGKFYIISQVQSKITLVTAWLLP